MYPITFDKVLYISAVCRKIEREWKTPSVYVGISIILVYSILSYSVLLHKVSRMFSTSMGINNYTVLFHRLTHIMILDIYMPSYVYMQLLKLNDTLAF